MEYTPVKINQRLLAVFLFLAMQAEGMQIPEKLNWLGIFISYITVFTGDYCLALH